ncbi:HAMP domain-containing sensor histidine kinase [Romboutsia sp.]|uniref:sensor histidine kinase n=1 Tax=Romboutsia sp. TaxID=1965302 RepID=UPI002CA1E139|nr:HAMP domain-containing sensor histidine kinase [Romboutsia sp.]HSQ88986.1 HAMP domain-containing sensor histidine kinase [Romboutsia sp.]
MINKNILYKTKKKLIILNTLVVGVLFLIFSTFIYAYFHNLTYKAVDEGLYRRFEIFIKKSKEEFRDPITAINRPLGPEGYIIYILKDGRIIHGYENDIANYIRPYEYNEEVKDGITSYKYKDHNFRELKKTQGEYTLEIIKIVDVEVGLLKQLVFVLFMGMMLSLGAVYLASRFLTRKSLEPIEASWENQVLFVQDASHELRTPLAIIFSKVEGIIKRPESTVEDEMKNLTIIMKESRRLRKLVSDLLKLTKEDAIVMINKSKFNLEELVKEILVDYGDIASLQDKIINFDSKLRNINIYCDREKIKQLLIILIDNAMKYTNSGDEIDIILSESINYMNIIIRDSGIGIKEDEIKNIFNRFYRSNSLRGKNIEGSGVGLSIAKTIISTLRGNIKVESKLGEGTSFYVNIPK